MERRNTIQKELVLNAVKGMHRHVTAEDVFESIKTDYPSIGKGTIYRNLAILADENMIRRVEIPGGPVYFDFRLQRHYHLRCIDCGNIVDVNIGKIPQLDACLSETQEMLLLDYDIIFKGICPDCLKKEKGESNG